MFALQWNRNRNAEYFRLDHRQGLPCGFGGPFLAHRAVTHFDPFSIADPEAKDGIGNDSFALPGMG